MLKVVLVEQVVLVKQVEQAELVLVVLVKQVEQAEQVVLAELELVVLVV